MEVGLSLNAGTFAHENFEAWCEQKNWTDAQHSFAVDILATTMPSRLRLLRELFSGAHASFWLTPPSPQHPADPWRSADWQLLLRWRLGMFLPLPLRCTACSQHQDAYGDHALCCKAMGVYARHNVLRNKIAELIKQAGFVCMLEVALPGTALVPADVFVPSFFDGETAAVDAAVTHPLHPSAQAHGQSSGSAQATVVAGIAAEARANAKVAYYEDKCRVRSWFYYTFVAETTGAVNEAGQRLVRRLTRAEAQRSGEDPAEISDRAWHGISSAVARSVAAQLTKACAEGWLQPACAPAPVLPPSQPNPPPPPSLPEALQAGMGDAGPAAGDLVLAQALCC